jgi:hypothetical protein
MDTREPQKRKPKLTDAERHKRFLEVAKKVDASDKADCFDEAFISVTKSKSRLPQKMGSKTMYPRRGR